MTIIFSVIAFLVLLVISLYLFDNYKVHDHQRRNPTTLYWAIGFLIYSLGMAFSIVASERLISNLILIEIFTISRFILIVTALLLIYSGVMQLISQKPLWNFYLPVAVLILTSIWLIYTIIWLDNSFLAALGFVVFFQIPLALILTFSFLMLFSLQLVQRQEIKSNLGALILALAFATEAVEAGMLPWVLDTPFENLWAVGRVFTFLLILWGLVRLEKDAEQAFDHKLKIHALKIKE